MQITNWHEFYGTLVVESGYREPVPKPTPAMLARFEAKTGFRLPRSYRDYIQVFGPGEFPCVLKVAAPGYKLLESSFDLARASRSYGYSAEEIAESGLPNDEQERMRRLVYFGLQHGRQWLGWDPQDVRDAGDAEYGIYRVDWLSDGAEFVAASFRELVEQTCEALFAPDPEYDEEAMGPQRAFQPACLPTQEE